MFQQDISRIWYFQEFIIYALPCQVGSQRHGSEQRHSGWCMPQSKNGYATLSSPDNAVLQDVIVLLFMGTAVIEYGVHNLQYCFIWSTPNSYISQFHWTQCDAPVNNSQQKVFIDDLCTRDWRRMTWVVLGCWPMTLTCSVNALTFPHPLERVKI